MQVYTANYVALFLLLNKLEFMFMKHYAPNRCEPSIEFRGEGGDPGRCERRSEIFVKFQFFLFVCLFVGGGIGGGGVRMDVNEELKCL